jgi:hypothetical protein
VLETSALVFIAERETPAYTYGDYFQVFNFDLSSGKKVVLEEGFRKWKKLVRFDPQRCPTSPLLILAAPSVRRTTF